MRHVDWIKSWEWVRIVAECSLEYGTTETTVNRRFNATEFIASTVAYGYVDFSKKKVFSLRYPVCRQKFATNPKINSYILSVRKKGLTTFHVIYIFVCVWTQLFKRRDWISLGFIFLTENGCANFYQKKKILESLIGLLI